MKKLTLALFAAFSLVACSNNWEYKIVKVEGTKSTDYHPRTYEITNDDLNIFGKDGWELVDVYVITETVHPNFGNSEYVTGIRENTRTQCINYVFKRKI
ncbi:MULTISPECIES: DUF4177 domain-containing protein [unclassified Alistipes]|uniref:DUF4177 domain-containing protein n=1 Tax=unclassified Alistipes TaxID=2608932 RepID=UPI002585AB24|nr:MULTISPECIES: DUF4177 domain-containing protein [unclassified Alistipes]HUN14920.1 DUF4177 domain-containing protein [Alistipes sp.]